MDVLRGHRGENYQIVSPHVFVDRESLLEFRDEFFASGFLTNLAASPSNRVAIRKIAGTCGLASTLSSIADQDVIQFLAAKLAVGRLRILRSDTWKESPSRPGKGGGDQPGKDEPPVPPAHDVTTRLSVRVLKPGGVEGYSSVEVAFSRQRTMAGAWNTNSDGWIWNAQDTPGRYTIRVTGGLAASHRADSQTVELREGEDRRIPIHTYRVGTSTTSLLVNVNHKTREGTKPLENAGVELSISYSNVPNRHGTTDESGSCPFFGIEPGTYYVTATGPRRENTLFISSTKTTVVALDTNNTATLNLTSRSRVSDHVQTELRVTAKQTRSEHWMAGAEKTNYVPIHADPDVHAVSTTNDPDEYCRRLDEVLRTRHQRTVDAKMATGNYHRPGVAELNSSWSEHLTHMLPPVDPVGDQGKMLIFEYNYSGRCLTQVTKTVED